MLSTVTKFIRKSSFIVALALHLAAVSVANAQVVPDAPQNLAAANHSSTTFVKVVLTWDTPDNTGDSPITHVCYQYRSRRDVSPNPYWTNYSQPQCVPVSNVNSVDTVNLQSGELHEFDVALQNSAGRSNWAVVFFTPGFSPTLEVQPTSVAENAAATEVTVTVTLGNKAALRKNTPVTVSVGKGTATSGTDYTAVEDFSVTVPSGQLTATGKFTLTPADDNMVEGNETIDISGTASNFVFANVSLTIVDDDVNSPPVFASETLTRSIAENTAGNNNVGAAIPAATDANSDPLTYTMEGTDAGSFTFDAPNRQIKTKSSVTYDHEAKSSYSVTIKASDGSASDTVRVTINVTDVDEPPSAPSAPMVSGASTTSLSVSWSAPSNTGKPAITSYDLQYRAGSTGGWTSGPQNQTGTSATISGLAAGTSYQVQVRATNDEGDSPWSPSGTGSTNTTDDDVSVSLLVSPNPVMEGESVTVTVVMSEEASRDMMIPLTVTQDSSEEDDHGTLSQIMIPKERASAPGTIATNQDTDSDNEMFTVALGTTLPPGCVAGSPAEVTVMIVDDDRTNPPPPDPPPCGESDREDLESFYEMTDGEGWHENENWKSEELLGEWFGVGTDEDDDESVISLRLPYNGLSGDMPTDELLCLNENTELVELALWGNDDLEGEVPEELVLAVERAVLRDIAEMLNLNPEWFENYEEPFDFEDWHAGVTTDDEERVTELDFTGEEITGEIPGSVFELQRLEEISTGCGITFEAEAPERVSVIVPDECAEETISSGGGGCALGSGDSPVFGLFLVTLLVFAALGRRAR